MYNPPLTVPRCSNAAHCSYAVCQQGHPACGPATQQSLLANLPAPAQKVPLLCHCITIYLYQTQDSPNHSYNGKGKLTSVF